MDLLGAAALAQPDHRHLHQAALDIADKERVGLDTIANDDVVGLEGVLVEIDRISF